MQILTILKALKWGWKALISLVLIGFVWVGIVTAWRVVAFANPAVKEIISLNDTLTAENLTQYQQLRTFEAEVAGYVAQIKEDSINFAMRLIESQLVASQLGAKVKAKDNLIANYKKGIQVDLLKLTYKDGVFSKPKLVDSAYVSAWRFGVLE